ncbi:MAG: hypothetical protein AAB227_01915 [Pseudomonadota bacterium]
MLRSIIAVTAGVLLGVTVVIFGAFIVTQMTPELTGLKSLPVANKFGVVGVWFVGAFLGALIASFVSRRWAPASWVVAATMALFALSNFASDPAPLWMAALTIAGIAAGGWVAVQATSARYGAPPAAPKPGL